MFPRLNEPPLCPLYERHIASVVKTLKKHVRVSPGGRQSGTSAEHHSVGDHFLIGKAASRASQAGPGQAGRGRRAGPGRAGLAELGWPGRASPAEGALGTQKYVPGSKQFDSVAESHLPKVHLGGLQTASKACQMQLFCCRTTQKARRCGKGRGAPGGYHAIADDTKNNTARYFRDQKILQFIFTCKKYGKK